MTASIERFNSPTQRSEADVPPRDPSSIRAGDGVMQSKNRPRRFVYFEHTRTKRKRARRGSMQFPTTRVHRCDRFGERARSGTAMRRCTRARDRVGTRLARSADHAKFVIQVTGGVNDCGRRGTKFLGVDRHEAQPATKTAQARSERASTVHEVSSSSTVSGMNSPPPPARTATTFAVPRGWNLRPTPSSADAPLSGTTRCSRAAPTHRSTM